MAPASAGSRSSSRPRMRAPTEVAPGSRVTTTSQPAVRSRSASSRTWVDLPAPSPPSKTMNRPTRTACSAKRQRPSAHGAEQVAQQRDALLVVHLAQRGQPGDHAEDAGREQQQAGGGDVDPEDQARAAQADHEGGQGHGEQQGQLGTGLDEGEHPAADVVADLAPQQRGAGQERHSRADPDADGREHRDHQVPGEREDRDGQRGEHDGQPEPAAPREAPTSRGPATMPRANPTNRNAKRM